MERKKITLKTARLIAGYTQDELAELMGVHPHTISDWEKRPSRISIGNAKKLKKLLGIEYENFFYN